MDVRSRASAAITLALYPICEPVLALDLIIYMMSGDSLLHKKGEHPSSALV